jgi:UPF0176 protein
MDSPFDPRWSSHGTCLEMNWVVATFYKFASFPDYAEYRQPLRDLCGVQQVRGTILLAHEGINGTIAGSRQGVDTVLVFLRSDPRFYDLEAKESESEDYPFARMKVRLKQEIVTLGQPKVSPCDRVGTYVEPQDWNTLISDPTVTIIDTRNDYEVKIGTFQGAQNPQTDSFREFPNYVQQTLDPTQQSKVALFCTGGIRCEKATAYLLQQGFAEVYHLKGGILKYLETVSPEESLWQGECFVFDERVAIDHNLKAGTHKLCKICGQPIVQQDLTSLEANLDVCYPPCG